MKKIIVVFAILITFTVNAQYEHETTPYTWPTDEKVLAKTGRMAGFEVRAINALGCIQPVGNCGIVVDLP